MESELIEKFLEVLASELEARALPSQQVRDSVHPGSVAEGQWEPPQRSEDSPPSMEPDSSQQQEDHKLAGAARYCCEIQIDSSRIYGPRLERVVPTSEVGDISMVCQLFASHRCAAVVADIRGAFNQAYPGQIAEALYVLLPDEYPLWLGVRLAKLVKELYGLLPGPASWRYTLVILLSELKKLRFVKHGICPCLWCYPEVMEVNDEGRCANILPTDGGPTFEGTMGGWILVQTDDLLMGGNGTMTSESGRASRRRLALSMADF
eukprot:6457643-Amphidinium_carterae.3